MWWGNRPCSSPPHSTKLTALCRAVWPVSDYFAPCLGRTLFDLSCNRRNRSFANCFLPPLPLCICHADVCDDQQVALLGFLLTRAELELLTAAFPDIFRNRSPRRSRALSPQDRLFDFRVCQTAPLTLPQECIPRLPPGQRNAEKPRCARSWPPARPSTAERVERARWEMFASKAPGS